MEINTKIEDWKRRLLDIGRTNKLINYKELRVGSITIKSPNYKEILNVLYHKNKALEFIKKEDLDSGSEENIEELLKEGQILTGKSDYEVKKSLSNLRLRAKNSLEEQGVNILYLAIGFLEWIDKDNKSSKSPIILFPVTIKQGNIFENHKLELDGGEIVLNPALQLKFESEFNIVLENPTEDDLLDIDGYFNKLDSVLNNDMWTIDHQVELGTFSFQKIAMYKDFDEIENQQINNKIVAAITGENVNINSEKVVRSLEKDLDNVKPIEVFQVLDADSSQQKAIQAAKNGLSFVMQGPPGTGKSQTITNIIAECLSIGKSVLFVSEKLAALNVVHNRLKQNGLEEFCLQLHSNKSNKKDIIRELSDTLNIPRHEQKSNLDNSLNNLYRLRQELNDYSKELHMIIKPFGKSIYEAYGMLASYENTFDLDFKFNNISSLTEDKLDKLMHIISSYSIAYKKIKDMSDDTMWRYCSFKEINEVKIKSKFESLAGNLNRKDIITKEIKDMFGLYIGESIDEFNRLIDILYLMNQSQEINMELLVTDDLNGILSQLSALRGEYNMLNKLKSIIEEKYTKDIYTFDYLDFNAKENEYNTFAKNNNIKVDNLIDVLSIGKLELQGIKEYAEEKLKVISDIHNLCNVDITNSNMLNEYRLFFDLIKEVPKVNEKWLNSKHLSLIENIINEYHATNIKIDALKEELFNDFDKEILTLPINELLIRFRTEYSSGFKILKSGYYKDVKLVKGYYKGSEKLTDTFIQKILEHSKEVIQIEKELSELKFKLKEYLEDKFIDNYTNWDEIRDSIVTIKDICGALKDLNQENNKKILSLIIYGESKKELYNINERIDYVINNEKRFIDAKRSVFNSSNHENNDVIQIIDNINKYKEEFINIDKRVRSFVKNYNKFSYEELREIIPKVNSFNDLELQVNSLVKKLPTSISYVIVKNGISISNINNGVNMINSVIEYKVKLKNIKEKNTNLLTLVKNIELGNYLKKNFNGIVKLKDILNKELEDTKALFNTDLKHLYKWNSDKLSNWVNLHLSNIDKVRVVSAYYKAKEEIKVFGISELNIDDLLYKNSIKIMLDSINKRMINLWIEYQTERVPEIRDFSKDVHDIKVNNFKIMDKEQFVIAKLRLKSELSKLRPESNIFSRGNKEVSILLHEASKKRMHLPIRKLFNTIPNLIFQLKPCFLMSPLAVSSFLDVNKIKFDVVIFDEASQICPEDAIGSMLRGEQVIVVGDSEQLPPTRFFTSSVVNDEVLTEDSEELHESILDKCSSIMPTVNLKWHYRSRHEDLIAFSNKSIYKNLVTIPSSEKRKANIGVEFIKVENGYYERSGARVNRNEAEKVARLVFEHFSDFKDRSLGVVTFSESQSVAIETAVRKYRELNPSFEEFFAEDKKEPFFIKNIESVQGDERDVIIFSIGYGKDISGNMSMNFGPLSKSGGYRRLNVAITRSKHNIKVVSSIEPSDIDLSRTNSEGVKMLKGYMEFAKTGVLGVEDDNLNDSLGSKFEQCIYDLLVSNGYDVDINVGTSEYKVNLAVKNPTNKDSYILAVEFDGSSYNNVSIARERDRLREELLIGMGWNFYRVWSTDWIKNRTKVENELLNYLKDVIEKSNNKEVVEIHEVENYEFITVETNIQDEEVENSSYEEVFDNIDSNNNEEPSILENDFEQNKTQEDAEVISDDILDVLRKNSEINNDILGTLDTDSDDYLDVILEEIFEEESEEIEESESVQSVNSSLTEELQKSIITEVKINSEENIYNNNSKDINENTNIESIKSSEADLTKELVEEVAYIYADDEINITESKIKAIEKIVMAESPVHISRVAECIRIIDGLPKATAVYKKDLLVFINSKIKSIVIKDGEFLWSGYKYGVNLRKTQDRPIHNIAKEEIGLCMLEILAKDGPKKKTDLFKFTLDYFGQSFDCNTNQRQLIEAVDFLYEDKKIVLKKGEIKLRNVTEHDSKIIDTEKVDSTNNAVASEEKTEISDEFKIWNVFEELRFKRFRNYCARNKINNVMQIEGEHLNAFQNEESIADVMIDQIIERAKAYGNRIMLDGNNGDSINKLVNRIKNNMSWLTPAQMEIAEYIINNIEVIPTMKSEAEFSKLVKYSTTSVRLTLMRLNLGTFNNLKVKIKRLI